MYNKILTAVDGSKNAEAAARYAIALAKECEARLFIVFVATENMGKDAISAGESSVNKIAEDARGFGISATPSILKGNVIPAMEGIVKREGIDLVVAASRRGNAGVFFIKGVAQELISSLPSSVAIIRAVSEKINKILVPVRSWEFCFEERVYIVSRLASFFNSEVVVFNVEQPPRELSDEAKETILSGSRENLLPLVDSLKKYGITTDGQIAFSTDPIESIISEASKYDLILIGAARRNIIKQLRNNPVEELFRKIPCDLMIWSPAAKRTRRLFRLFR